MISVKEYAYAKINLYLDVLSKRDDGFHEVKTVMHTVSLCDDVTVSVKPSSRPSVKLTVIGHSKLPTDSRNLAVKAAELFLESTLKNAEVNIVVPSECEGYEEIKINPGSHVAKLIARIDEESHRFAITYHRLLQRKRLVK